jgi:hypothetical protein
MIKPTDQHRSMQAGVITRMLPLTKRIRPAGDWLPGTTMVLDAKQSYL